MNKCWNQHGEKINQIITMVNRIVSYLMEVEIGYGMMSAVIWIIYILFVSMVCSYYISSYRLSSNWTFICFFFSNLAPLSCGSPDSLQNTTVVGKNTTVGSTIEYLCPKGHALIGKSKRNCDKSGVWSGIAPTCKCKCARNFEILRNLIHFFCCRHWLWTIKTIGTWCNYFTRESNNI